MEERNLKLVMHMLRLVEGLIAHEHLLKGLYQRLVSIHLQSRKRKENPLAKNLLTQLINK